ncbi:hypothetical protein MXB_2237, partial [Myxobolus squamalis]
MNYDDETDSYIPVFFDWIKDKNCWSYYHFLHFSLVLSDMILKPIAIITDFEKALIKACTEQFSKAQVIRCLFQFKQAL